MSAPGDILVRKVDGGWIVSTGIEADGWFVTNPRRVLDRIDRLLCGGPTVTAFIEVDSMLDAETAAAIRDSGIADAFASLAGRIDKLTLSIAQAKGLA